MCVREWKEKWKWATRIPCRAHDCNTVCSRLNQSAAMSPRAHGMRRRNPWQEVAGSLCPPVAHESPGLASPCLVAPSAEVTAVKRLLYAARVGGVRVPAWNPPPSPLLENCDRASWPAHWRRHLEHSTRRCYFANMEIHFSSYSFKLPYFWDGCIRIVHAYGISKAGIQIQEKRSAKKRDRENGVWTAIYIQYALHIDILVLANTLHSIHHEYHVSLFSNRVIFFWYQTTDHN